jgi:inosose dehydratase
MNSLLPVKQEQLQSSPAFSGGTMAVKQQPAYAPAIQVASAPVSWGIMENCDLPSGYSPGRVLDEIAASGFTGTELGPYGFLPTHPDELRKDLSSRGLQLCSAFVAVPLAEANAVRSALPEVTKTAALISAAGATMLILSDEMTPERSAVAGRRIEANKQSWTENEWKQVAISVRMIAEACRPFGLGVAFHHHVGSHVETPEEVERLLEEIPANEMNLCLDTGHYAYGGGDPVELLRRFPGRTSWLHFKDVDPDRLREAQQGKMDFHAAVKHGVFAPLGKGVVDFKEVLRLLTEQGYRGWAVVEQDVLPGGVGTQAPAVNASAAREYLRGLGI